MAVIDLDYRGEQSYYAKLVQGQKVAHIPSFMLESGIELTSVPVAYKTWGKLNERRDNVLVLCHALSGSSDAEDWWRPLMGCRKTCDYDRFFVFCANVLGSPYGSASPLTLDPMTKVPYGPTFPATTVRDDVRIHKQVLDALGVDHVAAVIGGSMGGFATLEWPLCTPAGYVKTIVPIATSAYHSAWGISWGEAQRQCIYADRDYGDGWYEPTPSGQPAQGLGAARMVGMLTYRSHRSFEQRFGRKPAIERINVVRSEADPGLATPESCTSANADASGEPSRKRRKLTRHPDSTQPAAETKARPVVNKYAAQSYLQYQADKFLKRFDANCYIHMTSKMDTHDVTRERSALSDHPRDSNGRKSDLKKALSSVGALVISVDTDVLFPAELQSELMMCLPEAALASLASPDGHDGFLLEFEALGRLITEHLQRHFPQLYEGLIEKADDAVASEEVVDSVFGEQEPEF
ncbi:hypothetical protein LTR85_010778 [Meristemomyces frigidus]|nr:hypothetical protein LTR85_010778 [Meristemomyces frigidus]